MKRRAFYLKVDVTYGYHIAAIALRHPRRVFRDARRVGVGESVRGVVLDEYHLHSTTAKMALGVEIALNPSDKVISAIIGALGCWEPLITGLFLSTLKRGMTVVDIGANIGWYTLLSASRVGPEGKVFAFEPEPENFSVLSRGIKDNSFTNVSAFQNVVSDFNGVAALHLSKFSGGHSIKDDFGKETIPIQSTRLDNLLHGLGVQDVDVMKVDVEGAEPEVLLGAGSLIGEGRVRNIFLEWNPKAWESRPDLIRLLFDRYEVSWISGSRTLLPPNPFHRLKRLTPDSMPKTGSNLYLRSLRNRCPQPQESDSSFTRKRPLPVHLELLRQLCPN